MIRGSGADLSQYCLTPLPRGVPVVLLAARLLVDKGVREFVQSAQILRQRGLSSKDVRFVVVGKLTLIIRTAYIQMSWLNGLMKVPLSYGVIEPICHK